jgi:alpha-D-ribose 1-methylphosphonate 5-triphosphate synthase subunit PhnI
MREPARDAAQDVAARNGGARDAALDAVMRAPARDAAQDAASRDGGARDAALDAVMREPARDAAQDAAATRNGGAREAALDAVMREPARDAAQAAPVTAPRVSQKLRDEGLIGGFAGRNDSGGEERGDVSGDAPATETADTDAPVDITRRPISFPAPRSARLQALARADTGFLSGLAYAGIRGFGPAHPTVGELRVGTLDVLIPHPLSEGAYWHAGSVLVTEVESLFPEETAGSKRDEWDDPLKAMESGQGEKADVSDKALDLGLGYGLVFGRNDDKAIAMSVMDYLLSTDGDGILQNQEFVLLHGDCLEMNGFLSHLKLPHYVTFQSKLDRVRHTRKARRLQTVRHTRKEARE